MKPIYVVQFIVRAVDYDQDRWYDVCIERLPNDKAILFKYYNNLFRDIGSYYGTHKNLFLSEYVVADGLTIEDVMAIRDFKISNFQEGFNS